MCKAVLLIDYGPRSIGRISSLLRGAGYPTEVATDGAAGLRAFERLRPGLTLIQDLLPCRQGFEVCRLLKRTSLGRMSDVVMITSPARSKLPQVRSSGGDDFLEKPFDDELLLATVRRTLGPPTSPPIDIETSQLSAVDAEMLGSIGSSGTALPGSFDLTELDVECALDTITITGEGGSTKSMPRRRARRVAKKVAPRRRKKRAVRARRATAGRPPSGPVSPRPRARGIKRPRK